MYATLLPSGDRLKSVTLGRAPKAAAASNDFGVSADSAEHAHSSARTTVHLFSNIGSPSPVRWFVYLWIDSAL
jgi:hypothetical protein